MYGGHDRSRMAESLRELRDHAHSLNDRDHGAPPVIRDDLLKLHQLAMAVVNHGARRQAGEFFDLAGALDDQVNDMMEALEQIRDTLSAWITRTEATTYSAPVRPPSLHSTGQDDDQAP